METLRDVISQFQVAGSLLDVQPYGSGHINETFASKFSSSSGIHFYIHQRINHHVFLKPWNVMANIERVLEHTRKTLIRNNEDVERSCLRLVPTVEGTTFCQTRAGNYWRTYFLIDGARTYDSPENHSQVYEAAYAFGKFQRILADLPGEPLYETIPDFHNTPKRFQTFLNQLENDPCNRASLVKLEIQFILDHEKATRLICDPLQIGSLPTRITHNDTKLNNVMIDDLTGKGICVIDLDTVMPGSVLFDFGDMVRSSAANSAEDEPDLSKAGFNETLFEKLAHGYLDSTRDFLTANELDLLPYSGMVITLEQAIRFLTDYLAGDPYYKIKYSDHNLVRARTQIKLISEIEHKEKEINNIIHQFL